MQLGRTPYVEAWELQRSLAGAVSQGAVPDTVLLLEHPPVVTLGRRTEDGELHLPEHADVEIVETNRGGKSTFHGPGQLVGYPILDLKRHKRDLHWYLRQVEEALIRALAKAGIGAERSAGFTGVWTKGRKIASIGVHARDWVTWHGFALNVSTDLSYFDLLVPCGIQAVTMTSIDRELGTGRITFEQIADFIVDGFGEAFDLEPREIRRTIASEDAVSRV
jgi:lipoyl(octanoyl) transferase